MKHVAAYLLAQLGGKASPSEADITSILSSVGAEADAEKLTSFLAAVDGKDALELLAAGRAKMATPAATTRTAAATLATSAAAAGPAWGASGAVQLDPAHRRDLMHGRRAPHRRAALQVHGSQ